MTTAQRRREHPVAQLGLGASRCSSIPSSDLPWSWWPDPGTGPLWSLWCWVLEDPCSTRVSTTLPKCKVKHPRPHLGANGLHQERCPVPRPWPRLGTDQELLAGWETVASSHVPHQWL